MSEFVDLVPKDPLGNVEFRIRIGLLCERDKGLRAALMAACSQDFLFWVNAFCWTLDPRKLSENSSSMGARLPFITWDYQDLALETMESQLQAGQDLLIEKSRDMGASWLCCAWMTWRWLFREYQSFLLVSRKADLVEGDDDSLMSHVDFILEGLPRWMLSPHDFDDTHMYLKNLRTGSVIEGEATVKNVGRGGRRTAILLDEFAAFEGGGYEVLSATADTTNTRIMNSTPKGTANAFHAQRAKGTKRLRMHWSLHPEKRRGLYRPVGGGSFEMWKEETRSWERYAHEVGTPLPDFVNEVPRGDEGVRSPWYDRECKRRAHAWEIAQELDIDYQGSNYPFFDPRTLEILRAEFCREPFHIGRVVKTSGTGVERFLWHEDRNGPFKLWCRLDGNSKPPVRDYIVGCDIGQGVGSSNSAASAADEFSGEKVAELVGNLWGINTFAEMVYLLCGFFSPGSKALLIWEATGPGRTFGKVIVEELRYPRFYTHHEKNQLGAKPTQRYGWYSSVEGKRDLLQTYRELLVNRRFLNPSHEAMKEAGFYVFSGGSIEYQGPDVASDPSQQGANHGDRVIADALCAKLLFERKGGKPQPVEPMREAPVLSAAWRWQEWGKKGIDESKVTLDEEW